MLSKFYINKQMMSIAHRWICWSAVNHQARTFSSKFRRPRITQEDREIGSDAIFNQELKKMKHKVPEDWDIDSDHSQDILKVAQDYTKRGLAMKYARQAKFLGHQRESRSLSWDNIDKIRYLNQEYPEEWGIQELAKSFDVPEKTIKKVLKSKFTPDPERRRNQDLAAQHNTGLLEDKSMSSEVSPLKRLPVTGQPVNSLDDYSVQEAQERAQNEDISRNVKEQFNPKDKHSSKMQDSLQIGRTEVKDMGEWDLGDVYLESELEEAEEFGSITASDFVRAFDKGTTPPKVTQKGREFYDEDGEFLYKI